MTRSRLDLHEELCSILGSRNVYFQPPENIKLKFPCIVYNLDDVTNVKADNKTYLKNKRYFITIISNDPDYALYEDLIDHFEMCELDRAAVSESMNHWYLTLYW